MCPLDASPRVLRVGYLAWLFRIRAPGPPGRFLLALAGILLDVLFRVHIFRLRKFYRPALRRNYSAEGQVLQSTVLAPSSHKCKSWGFANPGTRAKAEINLLGGESTGPPIGFRGGRGEGAWSVIQKQLKSDPRFLDSHSGGHSAFGCGPRVCIPIHSRRLCVRPVLGSPSRGR